MGHVNIAVSLWRQGRTKEKCAQEAYFELCKYIPDLFDYVDDEKMEYYTVKEIRENKNILAKVTAYFTPYASNNKDLSEESIEQGLLYGLADDDYVYILDCHE